MNSNRDDRDRVIGSAQMTYAFAPWLSGMVRSGMDFYRDFRNYNINNGWIGGLFDGGVYSAGGFQETTRFNRETNSDFLLTASKSFMSGVLGTKLDFGGNRRVAQYRANAFGTDQLVVPGVYNISNAAKPVIPTENLSQRQVNSLYAQTNLSYRDYLFLNVTGRNDWSSTLPKQNNSYFYPSANLGFVFTEAVPLLTFGDVLSFGKIRAGWSSVGADNELPYQLRPTFNPGTPFAGNPVFGVSNTLPNGNLKPEATKAYEVGLEVQFFQNRLGLDATVYQKKTTNQILQADVSRASGFTTAVVNAGSVSNRGIEAQLNAVPVEMPGGFRWNVAVNYAHNRSKVDDLYGNLQTVLLGPSHWGVTIEARKGEPFGAIYGNPFLRNAQGQLLLRNGLPQPDATKRVLGHYPPDWTGSINNELHFRSVDFSFMFDTRQGGNIYSTGNMWGAYAGQLKETENRPAAGIVHPGIDQTSGAPNTIARTTEDYYHSLWKIQERWVYDASFVKLREMRLGYTFPTSLSSRVGVSNIKGALVGRNLHLWAKVPNIDPETAFSTQNEQGLEMGQLPSTRSVGFQISVTP
jgi:outer membrane receptor protein involved in Fe transport